MPNDVNRQLTVTMDLNGLTPEVRIQLSKLVMMLNEKRRQEREILENQYQETVDDLKKIAALLKDTISEQQQRLTQLEGLLTQFQDTSKANQAVQDKRIKDLTTENNSLREENNSLREVTLASGHKNKELTVATDESYSAKLNIYSPCLTSGSQQLIVCKDKKGREIEINAHKQLYDGLLVRCLFLKMRWDVFILTKLNVNDAEIGSKIGVLIDMYLAVTDRIEINKPTICIVENPTSPSQSPLRLTPGLEAFTFY